MILDSARRSSAPLWIALFASILGGIVLLGHKYLPLTPTFWEYQLPIPYQFSDSEHYIAMAQGRMQDAPSPYCKRVLLPLLAGTLARETNVSLPFAFTSINYVAFIVFGYGVALVLSKYKLNPWWAVLSLVTPPSLECLQRAYLPDLFHMTLVAIFFALVAFELEFWAIALLFVSFLSRDNTIVLCLVVMALGWLRHRKRYFWGGLLVLIAGVACESYFTRLGAPNRHHLAEFVYMAGLVPCSFMGNVLGIVFWTDAGGAEGAPLYHWPIPHFLQFGADHEVYVNYRLFRHFETLLALTTLFGCGPMFVWFLWKRTGALRAWPLVMQMAVVYGIISYFLGTSLGRTGTFRLIAYSWPFFWIALPYLFSKARLTVRWWEGAVLVLASLVVTWTPNVQGVTWAEKIIDWWLLVIPAMYVVTAICLRRIAASSPVIGGQRSI